MTALDSNLKKISSHLISWVEKKGKVDLVNGNCNWKLSTKKTLATVMTHHTWMPDITAEQKFKNVGGNLQVISTLAKFVLMDSKALSSLNAFLSGNTPHKQQSSIPRKDIDYFFTKEFYVKSVARNLCCTANIIQNKAMVEKHFIIMLRQGTKNQFLAEDLVNNWPYFPKWESHCAIEYKNKEAGSGKERFKTLIDSNFIAPKHSPRWCNLGKKIIFCIYHSVLCDFFETSAYWGLNPIFPYHYYEIETNKYLAIYMK